MRRYLLISSIALSIFTFTSQLHSNTYNWLGTTNDLTLNTNWSSSTVPGVADTGQFNTATTGVSLTPSLPGVSTTMTPGQFSITGQSAYTFFINPTGSISFALPGGISNLTALTQNVNVTNGSLSFASGTTPGSLSMVNYSLSGSSLTFNGSYTDANFSSFTLNNNSSMILPVSGFNVSVNSVNVVDSASTIFLQSSRLTLNSANTTNTINGSLVGASASAGILSVQGTGNKVILTNSGNSYSDTIIGSGALVQANTTALPGTTTIAANGTLDLEQAPNTAGFLSGTISGAGNVTINNGGVGNNGIVVFSNANTYTGTTTITTGNLSIATMSAIQNSSAIINNGNLDFATTGTYSGPISGTGNLFSDALGLLQLSGPVSYTGSTFVDSGTLELDNVSALTGNVVIAGSSFIDFNQVPSTPATISGTITGAGGVIINGNGGTGTVIFTNSGNTYTGNTSILNGMLITNPTTQPGNIAVTSPGIIDFEQPAGTTGTFPGLISGTGNVGVNFSGNTGTVILGNASNNYSGSTTVYNGILYTENLTGLGTGPLVVNAGAQLTFHQTTSGILNNTIQGAGTVLKDGSATLKYNVDSGSFTGLTDIKNGTLIVDHVLGGNVIVRNASLLQGKGHVKGKVHVSEFSGISPGDNTTDAFTIDGNFKQSGESTYFVTAKINNPSGIAASKINVGGTATISPLFDIPLNFAVKSKELEKSGIFPNGLTTVNVNTTGTGQLPLGQVVTTSILHADGGVTGEYGFIVSNYPLLSPYLTYGPNDVFLNFTNTLAVLPITFNEEQVSIQLQSITNPTPLEESILVGITSLPTGEAQEVLDQLSGEQYTTTLLAAELSTRGFIRRLFDPLRLIINAPYEESCCCNDDFNVQTWGDASGHQAFLHVGQNFHGLEISGFEFGAGAQMSILERFTIGGAYSYEKDFLDYHVGGSAKTMVNQGAVYALFRPNCYYVLGDFVFGCSHNKIKRKIQIGATEYEPRSNVKVWQAGYYVEAGKDFLWRYVLAQPFVALEGGHYRYKAFTEKGGYPLALAVNKKVVTPAYTRFGVHLTTRNRPAWWQFGVDLAWMYRLTSYGTSVTERFLNFGDEFFIEGPHLQRNSFEAAVNFSVLFCRNWEVFGEVTAQSWTNTTTYSFLGGLSATW